MPRGLTAAAALAPEPLQAAVDARLDARLARESTAAVALGLSGGGDSLALLRLAAAWCARARRPLLALTVDHGLHADSSGWTARAGGMAAAAGAGWRALAWTGAKPETGVPAAARAARHALLAEAARQAGARVVLLAHTADDHAETEALRDREAPSIGRLREWAPSPAWPQGRGVFLLRPLLATTRADLRRWLVAKGLTWLDDPANTDPRSARARIRATGAPLLAPAPEPPSGWGAAWSDGGVRLSRAAVAAREPGARRSLAAAAACTAGALSGPRGEAMERLLARLAGDDEVTATLGGARVEATRAQVVFGREIGRRPLADLELEPGRPVVWDGRFEVETSEPGWRIGAAQGRRSRLPQADQTEMARLPAILRMAHPVLLRGDEVRLRTPAVRLHALAPARYDAAVGRIAHERDLAPPPDPADASPEVRTSAWRGTTAAG